MKKLLASGKVVLSKFNEANIQLDKPLGGSNEKEYWVFIDEKTYGDIGLDVFIGNKVQDNNCN